MARVCGALRISRSTAYRASSGRPQFYRRKDDSKVLAQIRAVTRKRATYGHRQRDILEEICAEINQMYGTEIPVP
jgi:hypothetical protein